MVLIGLKIQGGHFLTDPLLKYSSVTMSRSCSQLFSGGPENSKHKAYFECTKIY